MKIRQSTFIVLLSSAKFKLHFWSGLKVVVGLFLISTAMAAELPVITAYQPTIQESIDSAGFTHPGVGLTKSVLENARAQIIAQQEPWYSYYKDMVQSAAAGRNVVSSNATDADPVTPTLLAFNSQTFNSRFIADGLKVYTQALMFYITGDEVYRTNAMNILRVWQKMDPAQYAYFSDAHIHTGIPMNRMLTGAEILRYSSTQNSASSWTDADTQALTNNLIVPATETFMHRNNEFMNQHNYPLMGAMAGYIFTGNSERYAEAVEWMTVNRTALNQGFNGSIKRLFRLVDKNAKTGEVLTTPVVQHVEMGRDQAHGGGDLNNAAIIARMFYAQNTKVDPVTGELSEAGNALGMYEFLNDRVLHAADYFWRYMSGYQTDWVPTEFSIFSDGRVGGIYNFISSQYRGRMLTTNFWDLYYYYTYEKGVDLSVVAPYFYQGFKKRVPTIFYYARGLANTWDNVDGGGDFWLYIPPAAIQEGGSNLPKPQLNASLIEPEERYSAFDANSQSLSESNTDFVRLLSTPDGSQICLLNFSYGSRSAQMLYGIRVRTDGTAKLALSTAQDSDPYVEIELPDTNGEWRYIVYDAGTTAIPSGIGGSYSLNYVSAIGDGTLVDIDNFNTNAGVELSAPVFQAGNENKQLYTYVGASINVNFAATDTNAADLISYSVDSLPSGAVLNPQTGEFSFTANVAGSYNLLVTASDGEASVSKRLIIHVGADRTSAISEINDAFNSQSIYTSDSLLAYQNAFTAVTAGINSATDGEFAALLVQFQEAINQLQLLTLLLPDGSFDYPATLNSSTYGSGIYVLVDSDPDTFSGFLQGKNSFHILDFGIDHKVSANAIGIQARMNFADRGAGITVFASNDSQNWVRISSDETPFQDDISILPVDAAYQNVKYRYFKLQLINPQPEALRGEVQNLFEISELHIWGQRFETNNKIESITADSSNVGANGLVYTGNSLSFNLTTKEAIENLSVTVQGVNAQVSSTDGIHWIATVNLGSGVATGSLNYYVQYTVAATGEVNDAFIKSGLYLTNGDNILSNIKAVSNLIDPSTSYGRPSATVTAQQVANLFDNDAGTVSDFRLGGNGAGGYITFDFKFGGSVSLTGVDILARQDQYYSRINGTRIQASSDNINWVTISSSAISTADWQSLSISDQQRYRYIRVFNSNSWFGNMAEIRFHGDYRGPVDLINAITLSSPSAEPSGLVHTGELVNLNIGTTGAINGLVATIQGVPASVSQVGDNEWIATATMPIDAQRGYINFNIAYQSENGSIGSPETSTTDSSRLFLIRGDDLLMDVATSATLIDPSTTSGRPNATVTAQQVANLFDGNSASISDFRAGTNGTGGYVTFDFNEGNSVWISGVDVLARQDSNYGRIAGMVVQGSNDNANWTTLSSAAVSTLDWQTLNVTTQSSYRYIRIYNSRSWFGNMAELRLHTDNQAPVTQSNASEDWVNTDVYIEFIAADDISGVSATYFAINDGEVQSGTSISINSEGANDLIYWSEDLAGNVEDTHYSQIKLDKTSPAYRLQLNAVPFSGEKTVFDNQTLELEINDSLSGLAVQQVYIGERSFSPDALSGNYQINLTGLVGSQILHVYAEDRAGNRLNSQISFNVELSVQTLINRIIQRINSSALPPRLADRLTLLLRKIEIASLQKEASGGVGNSLVLLSLITNISSELKNGQSSTNAIAIKELKNDFDALFLHCLKNRKLSN